MTGSTERGKISLVLYVDVEHGVLIETLWNVKSWASAAICSFCVCVLIETLWNVKWTELTDYEINYSSINRNIVECKDQAAQAFGRAMQY